jgi:hypothetical protein
MGYRTDITDQFEEFLTDNGLDDAYGIVRTEGSKFHGLTFCKARNLDGSVRVYGPKFILVEYRTRYGDLPNHERVVFESVENAMDFIRLAFVEYKFDEAMDVPRRLSEKQVTADYEE